MLCSVCTIGRNKHWRKHVHRQANIWATMLTNWVVQWKTCPVLIVKYEKLKQNMLAEVKQMVRFLKVDVNEDEVERRVTAADLSTYKRKHTGMDFDPYTPELRQYVLSKVNAIIHLLKENHMEHVIQIQDYTRTHS